MKFSVLNLWNEHPSSLKGKNLHSTWINGEFLTENCTKEPSNFHLLPFIHEHGSSSSRNYHFVEHINQSGQGCRRIIMSYINHTRRRESLTQWQSKPAALFSSDQSSSALLHYACRVNYYIPSRLGSNWTRWLNECQCHKSSNVNLKQFIAQVYLPHPNAPPAIPTLHRHELVMIIIYYSKFRSILDNLSTPTIAMGSLSLF